VKTKRESVENLFFQTQREREKQRERERESETWNRESGEESHRKGKMEETNEREREREGEWSTSAHIPFTHTLFFFLWLKVVRSLNIHTTQTQLNFIYTQTHSFSVYSLSFEKSFVFFFSALDKTVRRTLLLRIQFHPIVSLQRRRRSMDTVQLAIG